MDQTDDGEVTRLLRRLGSGDRGAEEELYGLAFEELHGLAERFMRGERRGHTLQATALVNEAYLRLVGRSEPAYEGRDHFLRVASRAMRALLVDHARKRNAERRGGGQKQIELTVELALCEAAGTGALEVDEALRKLEAIDVQLARIVELRYFGGLTIAETARALGVSSPTIERGWRTARAWMAIELDEEL